MSNDKDTAAIRSVIDSLQSGMTEMIKYDNILQDHMDEDALLKDMEECNDRIRAIKIAIYKAQDYLDSIKTSINIKSEVKTSELYKKNNTQIRSNKRICSQVTVP